MENLAGSLGFEPSRDQPNTLVSLKSNRRERLEEGWLGVRDGIRSWLIRAA
jgi:hypothetical protein